MSKTTSNVCDKTNMREIPISANLSKPEARKKVIPDLEEIKRRKSKMLKLKVLVGREGSTVLPCKEAVTGLSAEELVINKRIGRVEQVEKVVVD
jgi:hypothetical protein